MRLTTRSIPIGGVLLLLLAPVSHAASDCPGDQVSELPYSDAGSFPTGIDDLNPIGLDLSHCGLNEPINENGPDFVVEFPVGAGSASVSCTLEATSPVLFAWGTDEACVFGVEEWIQLCAAADISASVSWQMDFIGAASVFVDALGNPAAEFTLECDGSLPVELEEMGVE
jgi:hypothetical protein